MAVEPDAALRTRFQLYLAGLSKATNAAIGSAVASVQANLVWTITTGYTPAGAAQPGFFFVVVDDGSGAPPSSTITAVGNAVAGVVADGISYAVYGPTLVTATISLAITAGTGYTLAALEPIVQTAIVSYVNSLPLGTSLPYSRIFAAAYGASPGVANVASVLLNGGTSDLTATSLNVIRTSAASVTVT